MMDVALFKKLFVNRDDTYAEQKKKERGYKRVSSELTDSIIKDHLNGQVTIGLYQLYKGTVKWACIDIDIVKDVWSKPDFKYEDWSDQVELQAIEWKQKLKDAGITSYLEESGNKGAHVWIFFDEPKPAEPVVTALRSIATLVPKVSEAIEWEIFPKQADAEFGSMVKGPNGYHQAGGKYSRFIDSLDNVDYVSWEKIIEHTNPYNAIFENCSALDNMVGQGLTARHLGHTERLALAYIFGNLGDGGKAFIKEKVFQHLSDWDEYITDKNLDRIEERYKPIACKKLQEQGICPAQCDAIGGNKSPIAFYNRAIGKPNSDDGVSEVIEALNPLDNVFRKAGSYYSVSRNTNGEPLTLELSNFVVDFERDVTIDDGINETRTLTGHIYMRDTDEKFPISIDAGDWGDSHKVRAALHSHAGVGYLQYDHLAKIIKCIDKQEPPLREKISKVFGFRIDEDGETVYATPSVYVDRDGVHKNDKHRLSFEGDQLLSGLDMKIIDEKRLEVLKESVRRDFVHLTDPAYGLIILAFLHVPLVFPFTKQTQKFHLHVKGQTGLGKTFTMQAGQRFYGAFDENHFGGWSSTTNALQRLMYYYKDAVLLLDDFKRQNLPGRQYAQALQLLQTSADGSTRHRLKSDSSAANSYYPKSWNIVTAEDRIEKEASTISRSVLLELPPRKINFEAGDRIKDLDKDYCGIMPYFIKEVLNNVHDNENYYAERVRKNRNIYLKQAGAKVTGERMAMNIGMLHTMFDLVNEFYYPDSKQRHGNEKIVYPVFERILSNTLENVQDERAGTQLWGILQSQLASGAMWLQRDATRGPDEESNRGLPIGYMMRGGDTYAIAFHTVYDAVVKHLRQMGHEITHSASTVLEDLYNAGLVLDNNPRPLKMDGKSVRMVRVPVQAITGTSDED